MLANNYTQQNFTFGWQLRNAENKPVEGVAILGKTNVMDIEPNNNTYECVNKSLVLVKIYLMELTILFLCSLRMQTAAITGKLVQTRVCI